MFEPFALALSGWVASTEIYLLENGAEGNRTPDLNNANVAFYQTKLRPLEISLKLRAKRAQTTISRQKDNSQDLLKLVYSTALFLAQ